MESVRVRGLIRRSLSIFACLGLTAGMSIVMAPVASAATITFDGSPGTAAPPGTLGPYTMTAFPLDAQPLITNVSSVPSPLGGSVSFGYPLSHLRVPTSWSSWSHGYTGDVYCSTTHCHGDASVDERHVVLTLPPGTGAFYFYAENDASQTTANITATADGGAATSGAVPVTSPSGAKYFGFWSAPGGSISKIDIVTDVARSGLGIGEFGIATVAKLHTLTVEVVGFGSVVGPGISCPGDCSENLPSGIVTLHPDSVLPVLWQGDCSGIDVPCVLNMDSDHFVRAIFLGGGDGGGDEGHRAKVHIDLNAQEQNGNLLLFGDLNSRRNRCESAEVELHRRGGAYLATTDSDPHGGFGFGAFEIRNPDGSIFVSAHVDRQPGCKPATSDWVEVPAFDVQ